MNKKNILGKLMFAATLVVAAQSAVFAQTGYSITDNNATGTQFLYKIDIPSGVATKQGANIGTDTEYEGLASSGGVLFGVAEYAAGTPVADVRIFSGNRPTGLFVGESGINFGTESGAAYNQQNGFIYSVASDDTIPGTSVRTKLYRISPSTGAATFVADVKDGSGANIYVDGLAISDGGTVYASDGRLSDALYTINLNTGVLTRVGTGFGLGNINQDSGLAWDSENDILYLLLEEGSIYEVDPSTGTATFVSQITDSVSGLPVDGDFEGFDIPRNPVN